MALYQVKAYAKINIGLTVGKKMDNGYHPIHSYFALLDFYDDISVSMEESDCFSCFIDSSIKYLDDDQVDIMEKCARAFALRSGKKFSMNIIIDKHIPFKAGLGGGSSDGAAIIKILNKHYHNIFSQEELLDLGASIGSDIPFFILDTNFAYASGRGEQLKKVNLPDSFDSVMLFLPDDEVSTKGAYGKLDALDYPFKTLPESFSYPLSKRLFPNDFERVCKTDTLNQVLDIYKEDAYASLSGSGSSIFVLMDSFDKEKLMKMAPCDFIVKRILR